MSVRPALRFGGALLAALALAVVLAPPAAHASGAAASWQFAPAEAPPPPAGAQPSPFPAALGEVGDIAFWAPNQGVLITAGNEFVSAGVYAYDGVSWHQLSIECGGHDGRIAWAGPNEFWTISDQRPGQVLASGQEEGARLWHVSLCHFQEGQIVGSYAMPLEQPDSYRPMDAAACDGPKDCWFGGELGEPPNTGAFHLYWNGSALSVVYSPQDHATASMTVDQSQIYESVQLAPGDSYSYDNEHVNEPPLLHTIVAADANDVFHSLFPTNTSAACGEFCGVLPEYGTASNGEPVAPDTLTGLALSSDWSPSGDGPALPQLWAVAGADSTKPPSGEGTAHPIALRYSGEDWTQIVPNLASFESGEEPEGVAADPGEPAAWITIRSKDETAHVDLLSSADGGNTWTVSERDQLGPEQLVGDRGQAGPIACPAAEDCWLATSEGWIFHLTDGEQLPQDTDPFFDGADGVITYRPPDNGVPEVLPLQPPEDDSLANQQPPTSTPAAKESVTKKKSKPKKAKALVLHTHSKVVREGARGGGRGLGEDVLELSFTLTAEAKVQLLASRKGHVVAKTAQDTLQRGRHTLKLALDPRHWPTKLKLRAKRAG